MLKMSTELSCHSLDGPVMGTIWTATFMAPAGTDTAPIRAALAHSVETVDQQMSTWKPDSDLMRLNAAPVGAWHAIPPELCAVLAEGLQIGRASGGAFDVAMGDLVTAWGFGPQSANEAAIRAHLGQPRAPAHTLLELDAEAGRARKHGALTLDLSGIAKGYGVDRMIAVLDRMGIANALVGLDGEMRATGVGRDNTPWAVAIERPDPAARTPLSMLDLQDAAVATSGDYRQWVTVGGARLSHTMHPQKGGPFPPGLASVTVLAPGCMQADAWATALMVLGAEAGADMARAQGLDALFLTRTRNGFDAVRVGPVFGRGSDSGRGGV